MNTMRNKVLGAGMKNMSQQKGFLNLPNDNIVKTIGVAVLLCLVCSIVVSGAATILKPTQVANKLNYKRSNILTVAGIADSNKSIDELFEQVETLIVDMATGEYTDAVDVDTFDQRKASKDPELSIKLDKDQDIAQIGRRAKYGNVYLVRESGQIDKIVLPIKGYGLWSTLYGFISLESDATTVSSITFYEHAETPGLGGEIENKKWQASWNGKRITDLQGQPKLEVIKGRVNLTATGSEYKIDGLAGATLTSNGVTNLIQFWMGENGFGPYLARIRGSQTQASTANKTVELRIKQQSRLKKS